MEAFKAFTALTLVDMLSGPLAGVRASIAATDAATSGLGARLGKLALVMAPVALAAGVILGAFGACAGSAMAFESAMADVSKVVAFETVGEFKAMSDQVKELAGRLPMAQEGIAAIIAAAGQSGVAKADLVEFAEQAAKMGIAFDLTGDQAGKMMADWRAGMNLSLPRVYALADAVNHLSNNMNATAPALGEVIQRVGALAMSCGLSETQVAALGTAFLSAGASPEIAATALKKFTSVLVSGTALSKDAAKAFESIGFSAVQMAKDMQTDAQGTIFKVLQALADKPKELQISLLKEMFGEEAIGAIAPLLANMGNLSKAFELVGDSSAYAGSMQGEFAARSKTTENALQLMRNRFKNLAISVGTLFLPAISFGADLLGKLAEALRWIVDSPFGQWLLTAAAALSAAVIAVTAFSGAMWGVSKLAPIVTSALAPLKAAILALGWPFLAVIAAIGLLYAAYTSNFGGIADTLGRWYKNITLVCRGVIEVFRNLTGESGVIRGELAKEIKAAGLEGFVTTVSKIVYRIKAFFAGIWDGLDFARPLAILAPVGDKLAATFDKLGQVFSSVFGGEITTASASCRDFGEIVGGAVSWAVEALATSVSVMADGLNIAIGMVQWLAALLTGDWAGACQAGQAVWDSLVNAFMSIADLFKIGDWLRAAWADATEYLSTINLYESGARILETLKEGILSAAASVIEGVKGVFSSIRDYLPFSDAKIGPLSDLTLSGTRLMTTLAEGAAAGAPALVSRISGVFSGISQGIGQWWDGLFTDAPEELTGKTPELAPPPAAPGETGRDAGQEPGLLQRGNVITIHIGNITLPNVKDGQGFLGDLENYVAEYGG